MFALPIFNLVFWAKWFAIFAHKSMQHMQRYTYEPWWMIPEDTAALLTLHDGTPTMLAAAWLNATVGSTWVPKWMIWVLFGKDVHRLVVGVTDATTAADGDINFRAQLERDRLGCEDYQIQTVKLAALYCESSYLIDRWFEETWKPYANKMRFSLRAREDREDVACAKRLTLMHAHLTKAHPGIRMLVATQLAAFKDRITDRKTFLT